MSQTYNRFEVPVTIIVDSMYRGDSLTQPRTRGVNIQTELLALRDKLEAEGYTEQDDLKILALRFKEFLRQFSGQVIIKSWVEEIDLVAMYELGCIPWILVNSNSMKGEASLFSYEAQVARALEILVVCLENLSDAELLTDDVYLTLDAERHVLIIESSSAGPDSRAGA